MDKHMSEKEILEFSEKIQEGLNLAERRMLEEKALRGQDVIVCNNEGIIQRIPAREALATLPK